jgi:hypothetical protein
MTHLTPDLIEQADGAAIGHLEICEQCRDLIVTDVDLGSTKTRVMELATAPASTKIIEKRPRPWVVVALAAGAVLLVFAPLLLLSPDQEPDVGGNPEVSLPVRPEAEPPPPPVPNNELDSFEMTFMVDGRQGRLIWDSPTFYEGLMTIEEGPAYDYGFYRTGTDWGFSDPEESFQPGAGQPDIRRLPDDPEVPWDALINRISAAETWSWIDGDEMASAEPTHPLATRAWSDGNRRLEVSEDGVPVLVERPGRPSFRVNQLTHRDIRVGEVGNNTDLPFDYALYLAETTSAEQNPVLQDGLVTFSDYQTAAASAAECADIELEFSDSLGMFVFPDDQMTADCVARHVDDIAEVWRVDSQFLDGDEFVVLWYTIEGRPGYAAMHQVEPGPERALASGDGWAISIAQRGEGYCIYSSADDTSSEGCLLPEGMAVPDVLDGDIALSYRDADLFGTSVVGIVTARADRVEIIWSSGEQTSLTPGERVEFGFRGFGMISRGDARGEPIAIEAYAGDELLGTQTP